VLGPLKADAPLLIDPDAELPLAVSPEGFKAVARQQHQALARDGGPEDHQALLGLLLESLKFPDALTDGKSRRALVLGIGAVL
jgi:hypothetical protein